MTTDERIDKILKLAIPAQNVWIQSYSGDFYEKDANKKKRALAKAQLKALLREEFRRGQEDCRLGGRVDNHASFQATVAPLIAEERIEELDELSYRQTTMPGGLDDLQVTLDYIVRRIEQLKQEAKDE